jgi:hypothetical protein
VYVKPGREQRAEEPETLKMIEVKMREQNVHFGRKVVFHEHTQGPHAGPGIEDERMPA